MNVALSPDGRQAAVDRVDTEAGIWLVDLARGRDEDARDVWRHLRVHAGLGTGQPDVCLCLGASGASQPVS